MALQTSPLKGRTFTSRELKAFEPQQLARTHDEELGYRRGFDQGVAALAYALGIDNATLQQLAWKQRVRDFRAGRIAVAPITASDSEAHELQAAVRAALQGEPHI